MHAKLFILVSCLKYLDDLKEYKNKTEKICGKLRNEVKIPLHPAPKKWRNQRLYSANGAHLVISFST